MKSHIDSMNSEVIRVCKVQSDSRFSICELHKNKSGNYFIAVLDDPEGLFVDFEIGATKNIEEDDVIQSFDKECFNRFTCYGEFTTEFLRTEHGEEIKFL